MTINRDEFFRQATVAITGTLDLEMAVERCHDLINTYFQLAGLSFMLYDTSSSTVSFLASSETAPAGDLPPAFIALPEYAKEIIRSLLKDQQSFLLITNDLSKIPRGELLMADLKKTGMPTFLLEKRSHIIVGLVVKEHYVALLEARKPSEQLATEEEGQLLLMLKEPLAIVVANALAHNEVLKLKAMLEDDKRFLQEELHSLVGGKIVGEEFGLRNVMEMVDQVAPKNSPVMLFGETGVGKDLIANSIHDHSPRRHGPFIKVNCGAIPESLIDSELFGHEKGAFTGALATKRGRFERAHQGTIFLDEVGELPPAAQVRLLRVLQNKEVERVGGTETIHLDVRVISATNRNIEEMVANRQFREDLFFRLNVFPILIPPLRQRKIDIPMLLHHFIEKKAIDLKIPNPPPIAYGVLDRLVDYRWPGNVRELENLVERELIMSKGRPLQFSDLRGGEPAKVPAQAVESPAAFPTLDEVSANHILRALETTKGKVHGPAGAAKLLGINPSTLRGRMNKLGLLYGKAARK